MKLRALFAGLTTIDIQYLVSAFPQSNSKTVADQFIMTVGGPATNAAIAFSHLGGESRLLSALGASPFSPFIESELQHYNVEFKNLIPLTAHTPTISSIISTNKTGHRAIITTRSPLFLEKQNDLFITSQDDYSVVLVDGFNIDICCTVAEQAKRCGISVVLDGGSWKDGMELLLPYIDIAICSENFHSPDGSTEDAVIEYLTRQGVKYRAITRGERPIIYSFSGGSGEIEIDAIEEVDTSGAGDLLHGAFCYYYAKCGDFVSALLDASKIATLSCQTFGTRAWMG